MSQRQTANGIAVEFFSSLCGQCEFLCILSHQTFLSPQKHYGKNLSVRPTKTIGGRGQLVDGARREDEKTTKDIQAQNRFFMKQNFVSLRSKHHYIISNMALPLKKFLKNPSGIFIVNYTFFDSCVVRERNYLLKSDIKQFMII